MVKSVKINILFVYLSSFLPAILTFVFWIIAANYTNPTTIGIIASITSFSMVLGVLSNFDVPIGMKRFIGKAFANEEFLQIKQIISVSSIFLIFTSIGILIVTLNPFFDILSLTNIDKKFIPIIITIVIGNSIRHVFTQSLISILKSKLIFFPAIISSVARFPLFFALLAISFDSIMNVAISYSIFYLLSSSILTIIVIYEMKKLNVSFNLEFKKTLKFVIHASFPRWIPQILSVIGSQLGILAVFAMKGAADAGLFYIPFAIYNVMFLVIGSITQVSHPVLSGISDESKQEQFLQKSLKFAFLISMPLVAIVFFYVKEIISVFGNSFIPSSEVMNILLLSFPLAIITELAFYLFYARGEYKRVLFLGLFGNVPRILLYYLLIPIYGINGSAFAFIAGTGIQLVLTIILIKKSKLKLKYMDYFLISIIPFSIAFAFEFINLGLIGIPVIVLLSILTYIRSGMLQKQELFEILMIFFNKEKSNLITEKLVHKLKKIYLM